MVIRLALLIPGNSMNSLPQAVTVDTSGTLYVADYANNMIRKISLQ